MLYRQGYQRAEVNALANFTFLTQETNLLVSDRDPAVYLEEFVRKQPNAVESHWIPMDRELWKAENYAAFLEARRSLLAQAANDFLDSLFAGAVADIEVTASVLDERPLIPGGTVSEEEERLIWECNEWVTQLGLPQGELLYELSDASTGQAIAILDLAWPAGLQEGFSQPVALLLGEDSATEELVNRAGFRFFTTLEPFRAYVERDILALSA